MGKLRARTDAEFAARRSQILDAAERQLLEGDFNAMSLATIAADISLSRPSMYNYFPTKEDMLAELLAREYQELGEELEPFLSRKMSCREFCEALADLFLSHKTLLKLLALQLPVLNHDFTKDVFQRFVQQSASYAKVMREVLEHQFPDASTEAQNMLFIQLSLFNNTLYELVELPQGNLDSMVEIGAYDHIPSPRDIYVETLMKLSTDLLSEQS